MKITYLFTTFPLLSERFLQREIEAMEALGVELEIFSLFRGEEDFNGLRIRRFRWWDWMLAPFAFLREYLRNPRAFHQLAREFIPRRPGGSINIAENFLGVAFAVVFARHFRRTRRHRIHAAWATGPATAALLLREISGAKFTMGAHAYDVFRKGGDWILEAKLQAADFIHTSTEATRAEVLRRGAPAERVVMIRRGLTDFPEVKLLRNDRSNTPVRLLSVGRLVEKKGFDRLLQICAGLKDAGIPFDCRIIGAGPLLKGLERLKRSLDLSNAVCFLGAQPYDEVVECYRWADLFCFTGRVAASSDRDGLPNVIPEAMAHGVPVLAALVSGTVEAIANRTSGYLIDPSNVSAWIEAIVELRENDEKYEAFRTEARQWVEQNFDARENARRLLEACSGGFKKTGSANEAARAGLR